MIWVIFNVIFLILVAVLMILNGGNSAGFNFFGIIKSDDVSTIVILIVGFVCGVLYSFLMYLISHFKKLNWQFFKRKKEKIKQKESDVKAKEKAVSEKEKELESEKKEIARLESHPESDSMTNTMDEIPAKKKVVQKRKTSKSGKKK
jgi:uncharacterized membrane protein YciS (DUF1049 family)